MDVVVAAYAGLPRMAGEAKHHAVGRIDASQAAMRVGGCHSALGRRRRGVQAPLKHGWSAASDAPTLNSLGHMRAATSELTHAPAQFTVVFGHSPPTVGTPSVSFALGCSSAL